MAGVIATHEAGIGLLTERTGEHPVIEGGGLGFVDALPGRAQEYAPTMEVMAAATQAYFMAASD